MTCKNHPYEQGVGVCAYCLRERLLALLASQKELPAHQYLRRWRSGPAPPAPPPLVFPRSVSPYISRRRSLGSDASPAHPQGHHHPRFFSTPQVRHISEAAGGGGLGEINRGRRRRFSFLKTLFGHYRSEEAESSFGDSTASTSGSWFSALIRGRRKKGEKAELSSFVEEPRPSGSTWRLHRTLAGGMSPELGDYDNEGCEISRNGWRRPTPTPMRLFPKNHLHRRSFGSDAGFSVCLSPLVRHAPNARRNQPAD